MDALDTYDTNALTTRSGLRITVRPATPGDRMGLADFFRHVTPEDLRFRFLSAVRDLSHQRLLAMTSPAGEGTESFVALDDTGRIVAAAMLACDAAGERGEVAVSIRADLKGQGIGWTLLAYLVGHARQLGYASIESIEDRQNRSAIRLEQEMGFTAEPVEGELQLVLVRKVLR